MDGRWKKAERPEDESPFIEELRRLYLDKRQRSQMLCYELACDVAAEKGWQIPSDRTARRYLAALPIKTVLLYRKGDKAYNDLAAPYVERDYTTIDSNDVWNGDHHRFDLWIDDGRGKPTRPWLSAWEDARSRLIVGWCIFNHAPNSDTILSSFRSGCLSYGVPKCVLIDNGKDFDAESLQGETKKQRFRRRREHRAPLVDAGVFGQLGIDVRHAEPYHGQSKPIERKFGTLCARFSKLFDSYCGNSPANRPDDLEERIKCGKIQLPMLDELRAAFADWLDADYHARPHAGDGMEGGSPSQVFTACLHSKRTATAESLDLLTLKKTRPLTIGRNGVAWQGIRYGRNQPELSQHFGQKVTLRIDDRDRDRVLVYNLDDSFLCIARANKKLPFLADSQLVREAIVENRKDRKTAKAFHEVRPRLADSLTDRLHRKAAERRAQQPAAPDQPPPSLMPVRAASTAGQQLEKVRQAIELEKRRPAVGSESVPLNDRELQRRLRDSEEDRRSPGTRISDAELRRRLAMAEDADGPSPMRLVE